MAMITRMSHFAMGFMFAIRKREKKCTSVGTACM